MYQSTVTNTDASDDALKLLIKYIVELVEDVDNREVVDDVIGETIENDSCVLMDALEGGDFDYSEYIQYTTLLLRGGNIIYLFITGW